MHEVPTIFLLVRFWIFSAFCFGMIFTALLTVFDRGGFRAHLRGCVLEGRCRIGDSPFHIRRERFTLRFIERHGAWSEPVTIWLTFFIAFAFAPIWGPLSLINEKWSI